MKTIEERARLAACQIYEEIGLSKHSVDRVSEIIEEKMLEQKAIDEQVRLKKCDDMTQAEYNHETAFVDWYLENGKGTPTYSDAIEWARKNLLDEVCAILSELSFFDWLAEDVPEGGSHEVHKDQFRKCFIEE